MNSTQEYYQRNADQFFQDTVSVDLHHLHARFLEHLPSASRILDAGCGSGRDAKAFLDRGFQVSAFDASPALAELASRHLGQPVQARTFAEVVEKEAYEGIWACASLLHVSAVEMPFVLAKLWAALKPGGVLYCSFKLGVGEREQNGRRFTDANEAQMSRWLESLEGVREKQFWRTPDARPERSEEWLNCLLFHQ
jgi:SAM-dependent methyltransferase